MHIDYPTLLLTASCTLFVFGLLCLLLSRLQDGLRPLRCAGIGNFLSAVGPTMRLA